MRDLGERARSAVGAPGPVDDEVSCDSIDPRPKPSSPLEPDDGRLERVHERLVKEIFGVGAVANLTHDEPEEARLVALVERVEGAHVSLLRLRVERLVR